MLELKLSGIQIYILKLENYNHKNMGSSWLIKEDSFYNYYEKQY